MNSRISKYLDKIDPIYEGGRDTELYRIGQCLRSKFGLEGDALYTVLSQVNDSKCCPPLTDSEVRAKCQSVDHCDIALGESTADTYSPSPKRKAQKVLVQRVNTAGVPVTVSTLKAKEVSLYQGCISPIPSGKSNIGLVLHTISTGGTSKERFLAVRNETDKNRRNKLKEQLPAVVFGSEPQQYRKNKYCKHNGVLCLDFDNIPIDELETAKQSIAAVPYVFAVGLSVSGRGLFALVHYAGTPDLKKLLSAMQGDFSYPLDTSCSDLCRLRYVTYDPTINIKDFVSPARLTEQSDHPIRPVSASKIIGGCFADVKDEPIDWLWKGRFARGHLQQIHGNPDSGKGYFTFWLASVVSRGGTFPDGTLCQQGSVLIVGTEEHAGYAKRKLAAQDTDMRNVHYVTGYVDDGAEFPILLSDINIVQKKCNELKNTGMSVSLVIVDPILQMLGVKSNDNSETQAALVPVKEFAERNNICFLCVNHDGKGQQETAANRSLGAQSIMGKMRIGYTAKKELKTSQDADYPLHTLAVSKFNIGRRPKAITFRIVEHPDDPEIGKVEILDIDGDFTADDKTCADRVGSKVAQCCQWLQELLEGGELPQSDIIDKGSEHGYSTATLRRAKELAGIKSSKQHFSGKWIWHLSEGAYEHAQAYVEHVEHLRTDSENTSTCGLAKYEHAQHAQQRRNLEHVSENSPDTPMGHLSEFDADNSLPVFHCPNCTHHTPATYPNGFCDKGYCQQNLPCYDFIEKAENTAA